MEVHVHPTSCCVSCTQSFLVLQFKNTLHGQTLLLPHRTTLALEKSQDDLNGKILFGSLNTDQSLLDEGNIALGSNHDNSADIDEDEIVIHDAPHVDNGTNDESSDDKPETQCNTTMSFARQVTWH